MRRLSLFVTGLLAASSMAAFPSPATNVVGHAAALSASVAAPAVNVVDVDFWTPNRLAGAVSREVLVRPMPKAKPDGAGKGNGGGKGKPPKGGGGVTGADWTLGGSVQSTTGKVYFTMGGTNYVCSGSSVNSGSGDLVLTAGHCVYDQTDGYATNFIFVPDHDADGFSFGQWSATQLITTTGWQSGDFNEDVGFAIIGEQGGNSLATTVGSQDIAFNLARGQEMYSFGYPAAQPYNGQELKYCAGVVRNDPYGGSTQGMTCSMTGGSSGGPWFQSFDEGTGTGTLNSVNSYKYSNDNSTMYGPEFDASIQSLFNAAEGLAA